MAKLISGFIPKVVNKELHLYIYTERDGEVMGHDLLDLTVTGYEKVDKEITIVDEKLLLVGIELHTNMGTIFVGDKMIIVGDTVYKHHFMLILHMSDIVDYLDDGSELNTWSINSAQDDGDYIHIDAYFDFITFKIGELEYEGIAMLTEDSIYVDDYRLDLTGEYIRVTKNDFTSKLKSESVLLRTSVKDVKISKNTIVTSREYSTTYNYVIEQQDSKYITNGIQLVDARSFKMVMDDNSLIVLHGPLEKEDIKTYPPEVGKIFDSVIDHHKDITNRVIVFVDNGYFNVISHRGNFRYLIKESSITGYVTHVGKFDFDGTLTLDGKPINVEFISPYKDDIFIHDDVFIHDGSKTLYRLVERDLKEVKLDSLLDTRDGHPYILEFKREVLEKLLEKYETL